MSIDVTAQGGKSLTARVAAQIRAIMAFNQIRQSHLARKMNVSEQWLSVRLRGVQPIDLNDLDRIATALGVEVASLLPKGGEPFTCTRATSRTRLIPGVQRGRRRVRPVHPACIRRRSPPDHSRSRQLTSRKHRPNGPTR